MHNHDLIEQLFNTILQLRKLITQRAYESHEEKAATMLQLSALNFLDDNTNGTVGDLAEFLQLSKSSATQLTERLVKMGLVKRISDKLDRRIIRLSITKEGEKERIVLKKKVITKMSHILSKLPEKDIEELIRIHSNLIDSLKKDAE